MKGTLGNMHVIYIRFHPAYAHIVCIIYVYSSMNKCFSWQGYSHSEFWRFLGWFRSKKHAPESGCGRCLPTARADGRPWCFQRPSRRRNDPRAGVEIEGIYFCDQGSLSGDDTMVENVHLCFFFFFIIHSSFQTTLNVHNSWDKY